MNPYEILGIPEDADKPTIKKAYRKLAAIHHPDRGGDEEEFKKVSEAYSVLSDDQKRRQYHAHQQRFGGQSFNLEDLFGNGFNPFGDFFTPGEQARRAIKKNTEDTDIRFNLKISLDQIKKGAKQTISFGRNKLCEDCKGDGGEGKKTCGICGGSGVQTIRPNPFFVQQTTCAACRGMGLMYDKPCKSCSANGYVRVQEQVTVKIGEGENE